MNRLCLLALAAIACSGNNDPNLCLGTTCVAVATSSYNADFTGMGTLDKVSLSTRVPQLGLDASLDPDTVMRIVGDELYVLQGTTGSLRIYDPKTFMVKQELPLGDDANPGAKSLPQDFIALENGKIFVSLAGNDAAHSLLVVDRGLPGTLVYVALPQDPTDTDGKPEPARVYGCNGRLYIALQSYSFDSSFNITYAPGRIAIIDPDSRTVRGVIPLMGKNPFAIEPLSDYCADVVVANASGLTTVPDGTGGLERVDLDGGESKGLLIDDNALSGRPTLLARAADNLLYVASYFDPEPNAMGTILLSSVKVQAFDPQKEMILGDISGKMGNVNFLRVSNDQLFYGAGIFADMEAPGKAPRGLYIGPADGTMITTPPIDLQLTPSSIALP